MEITDLIRGYAHWQSLKGFSPRTIVSHRHKLTSFVSYLGDRGVNDVAALSSEWIKGYQEDLQWKTIRGRVSSSGRFLSTNTRNNIISTLRMFLRWLYREEFLATDLAKHTVYAKLPKRLPKNILTVDEMEKILSLPDETKPHGLRDKLLLELLYGTGLRASELCKIKLHHVDMRQRQVFVEDGKGGKDRVLPLSEGLCRLISEYLTKVRGELLQRWHCHKNDYLFPGKNGGLCVGYLQDQLKRYGKAAELTKRVHPHAFRHAFATHMLNNGAPIRVVQTLLGHENINTTQVYTHVTINDLKKAHARYHPRERKIKR